MSVQAMAWAMSQAVVTKPTDRHVLLCLANYAGQDGTGAFPAIARLADDTGLSDRGVQMALARLRDAGVISPCDPRIVAAHITRADRRPNGWDIHLHPPVDNPSRGERDAPRRGEPPAPRDGYGVNLTTERGERGAPDPSINHQGCVYGAREPRPEVAVCLALRAQGQTITPSNPDLLAALTEGIAPETIIETARAYPDKPAGYAIAVCRREHAAQPTAITRGTNHAPRHRESQSERAERELVAFVQRYGT